MELAGKQKAFLFVLNVGLSPQSGLGNALDVKSGIH